MPVRKKLGFDIVFFTKFLMNEIKTNISRLSVFGSFLTIIFFLLNTNRYDVIKQLIIAFS